MSGPLPRYGRKAFMLGILAATVMTTATACGDDDSGVASGGGSPAANSNLLGPDNAATGAPVKIGWVSTGQTQAIDTSNEYKAAQATVAYANAKLGGLAGHPIELVVCEDKSVPAEAQTCGNRFVSEGVVAVAAGSPGQTDPWIDIIAPAGIPAVLNLASTQKVLNTEGVFVWSNPLGPFGAPAAFARDEKLDSAAVLVIDVPAASGPAKTIAPIFFANAGSSADVVAIPPGTPDMTPQVQAAETKNPKMWHIIGDPTFCSSAIKAIKTLGIEAPITAIDRCIGNDKGAAIPGGYEGVNIIAQANVDPNDAEFKLFQAVIDAYGGELTTDGNSVSGYQGMLGLIRAVNSSAPTEVTSASVLEALRTMPAAPYPLGGGATFQCDGQASQVSKNICAKSSLIADASKTGELSNFRTLNTDGIYKLG